VSLLRLRGVEVRFDDVVVMRDVHFRLAERERVGLIGKNGTGKTTLLRLVLGQVEPTSGAVDIDRGLRVGYFSQFSELDGEQSVLQAADGVFAELRGIQAELDEIGDALASEPGDKELQTLLDRQAELLDLMEARDGWTVDNRIDTALTKLGFSDAHRACPVDELSGGWRNRAALAKILLEAPDVLLLDEPTNYLDMEGVAWLEDWVRDFAGAVLVVTHDRAFLDGVATRIVELENHHLHDYLGDYTEFVRQKGMRIKQLERQFEHEETLLACEAEDLARMRRARKKPVKGSGGSKAKIRRSRTPRAVDTIINDIYGLLRLPDRMLVAEGITKGYGAGPLISNLDLELSRRQRLAIMGPNGCGKSTLVRVLVGDEAPDAGTVKTFTDVAFYNRYLDQLDPEQTAWRAVNAAKFVREFPLKRVHRFLELLRLSEVDRNKRIGALSGGQKARVALAQCLMSGAGLIVLDEPTNHLDITAAQVMERALVRYPGAVIVVSHDRLFVQKVATKRLMLERRV
jgi:ATPase subunit of ABC transporter with duplicated ATPase domains